MTFSLSTAERLARARSDMRIGLPVLLRQGDAMALVAAVETLTPERAKALLSADEHDPCHHRAAGGDVEGGGL